MERTSKPAFLSKIMTERWTPIWRQVFVTSSTCLNAIGNGCVTSFTAILLPKITNPNNDLHVSDSAASWVASTVGIGVIIGNLLVPFIMHRFGRKTSQILSTLPSIPAWFAIAWAQNATTLIIAKCAQGLAMGMYSMLSPILIGEMTSAKDRGMFLGCIPMGSTVGLLLGHIIGTLFQWRTTALICSTFPILTLLISLFIPESPHWLVSKSKFDKSEVSFRWLRGQSETEMKELDSLILAQKLKQTKNLVTLSNTTYCSAVGTILKDKAFFKPLLIMLNFCLMYHGTGLDAISNSYCVLILKQAIDFEHEITYYYIVITFGLTRLLASVLVIYVARRFNRRSSIFVANTLVIVSLTLASLYLYLKSLNLTSSVFDWIPVVFLTIYSFGMFTGVVPFTWTIAGEIFPMVYKSISSLVVGTSMAVIFFTVLKLFPTMLSALGIHGVLLEFACIATVCTSCIYFVLPETKGKTLQKIEEGFTGQRVSDMKADEIHSMLIKCSDNKS